MRSISYKASRPSSPSTNRQTCVLVWLGYTRIAAESCRDRGSRFRKRNAWRRRTQSAESNIDSVVDACLQGDEANRRCAVYALAGHDTESILAATDLLKKTTTQERCCAAFLLGELQEPRDVDIDSLLRLVADDSDTDVRMTATNALGRALRRRISKGIVELPRALVAILDEVLSNTRERTTVNGNRTERRASVYLCGATEHRFKHSSSRREFRSPRTDLNASL